MHQQPLLNGNQVRYLAAVLAEPIPAGLTAAQIRTLEEFRREGFKVLAEVAGWVDWRAAQVLTIEAVERFLRSSGAVGIQTRIARHLAAQCPTVDQANAVAVAEVAVAQLVEERFLERTGAAGEGGYDYVRRRR